MIPKKRPQGPARRLKRPLLILGTVSAWALPGWAQVYKWVDEQGRTHYGQSKAQAGGASATELRVPRAPTTSTSAPASKTPVPEAHQRAFAPPDTPTKAPLASAPRPAPSLSGGREDGSDASRCALAQDVLSGAVRHGNGKPTDQHDIDVANSDVRLFCR